MKSAPPPDSASFDSLWDADEAGEEGLPPALAPSLQGTVVPQEDRDTLTPPVPPADYVQSMMELGELDDPLGAPAQRGPGPAGAKAVAMGGDPPYPPTATGKGKGALGLVLASERELMLDEAPRPEPRHAPVTIGGAPGAPRRRSTGKFPAVVQPRADASSHFTPAPFASPRPVTMARSGGADRSGFASAGAAHALPVPRAPSIPPATDFEEADTFDAVQTLDGLGSLDALDDLLAGTSQPTPPGPPVALESSPWPTTDPRRYTPPAISMPTSSKPIPSAPASPRRAPGAAGLRLGKRTPLPMEAPMDAIPSERGTSPPSPMRWGEEGGGDSEIDRVTPIPASVEAAPSSLNERALEMVALFDAQNYSSALVLAESVLVGDPEHAQARRCAAACRERLTEKYLGNLGGRSNVPRVTMGAEEIRWLSLDHRAGFLLSFIDGSMSIDEVLDVSSMPELDALRIMFELRMQGVIEIVVPNRRPQRRS